MKPAPVRPGAPGAPVRRLALIISLAGIVFTGASEPPTEGHGGIANGTRAGASLVHYLAPGATYGSLERANDRALLELLERVGPDMKPASGFTDPANITLELARRAWDKMREHARAVANERLDFMWPVVERTLLEASASQSCLAAARSTAAAARQLETWAIKMLNSWGSFPPVGLFEGTLGDIGAFHGCLDLRPDGPVRHAHYCTFSYRPVLPTRADYALVVSPEPSGLLEHFGPRDAFRELAKKSQYNHYVYLKFGACLPIECSPRDAQRLAKLLGRRGILMSGPVKCHSKHAEDYEEPLAPAPGAPPQRLQVSSRDLNQGVYVWKPHVTGAQRVALVCLGALACLVLGFTLADLALNRVPKMLFDLSLAEPPGAPTAADPEAEELRLEPPTVMNHVIAAPRGAGLLPKANPAAADELDLNNNTESENENESEKRDDTGNENGNENADSHGRRASGTAAQTDKRRHRRLLAELVTDFSLITNTSEFFAVSKQQLASDILCMNGLRCVTMSWIILAHTIQYNDWAAFARIYEVESQLDSLANQPLFNASYLVDTFFLMSGLLTSFSVFRCKGRGAHTRPFREILDSFSWRAYLLGRYLRLTPQIGLVSLLFILLPLASSTGGPHWHSMTGEYSENCSRNWWVNLLHIQAFYKPDEMCNFVCWWISVDMLYHLLALAVILAALRLGAGALVRLCAGLALISGLAQAARHYRLALPPNMLSTIPQTGAMWTQMTLAYFWTPVAHTLPFALGLALGYSLARHGPRAARLLTRRRALAGWLLAGALLGLVLFGTRPWILGHARYTRLGSTAFALLAQLAWCLALAWTIVACQLGFGGFINRALSCPLFIVLGKASYLVYLSHFLVLFAFFGSQNLLLEPTRVMITYLILGNICLSTLFGALLCVAFEMPWLKVQRRIMRRVK